VVPEPLIKKTGARIMSLQDPTSKMSKSDEDENSYILLLDDEATIRRKIRRAVTDSVGVIAYNDEQLGIKNLLDIYASFTGKSIEDLVAEYEGAGYGKFKNDLAEVVVEGLRPIREEYDYLTKNKDYLEEVYKTGAKKASYQANKTLRKLYRKIGFVQG
ncbi:MAG TPA: tryptophan--tRNA ligase, partial [Tissierellaceae bacterium]|nr:tryptophan--tRNA ligase [Tissierellaceae bacterium]